MQGSPTFPNLAHYADFTILDTGTFEKYITPPRHSPQPSNPHKRLSVALTPFQASPIRTSRVVTDSKAEGLLRKLRAWEERAQVWAKERREFQKHIENCSKRFTRERLFKKAWHKKSSCQLDPQLNADLYLESTSRLEDLKDTAYSSNVVSDDESFASSRNLKLVLKNRQATIVKLKTLLEEETLAKTKIEQALSEMTCRVAELEQDLQSLEERLTGVYDAVGFSKESLLRTEAENKPDFGCLLQKVRELVVTSDRVDMYKAKTEAIYGSFLCPKCSNSPQSKDLALIELEQKDCEVQTLTAQTNSLQFKLDHEQNLNSQYLSQIKELQAKLSQSRRTALVNDTEQEVLKEKHSSLLEELGRLKEEHRRSRGSNKGCIGVL
jgi:hypothetical protein